MRHEGILFMTWRDPLDMTEGVAAQEKKKKWIIISRLNNKKLCQTMVSISSICITFIKSPNMPKIITDICYIIQFSYHCDLDDKAISQMTKPLFKFFLQKWCHQVQSKDSFVRPTDGRINFWTKISILHSDGRTKMSQNLTKMTFTQHYLPLKCLNASKRRVEKNFWRNKST